MRLGIGIMQRRIMLALRPVESYETDLLKVELDEGVIDLHLTAQAVAQIYEGSREGFSIGFSNAARSLIHQGLLIPLRQLPIKNGTEIKVQGPEVGSSYICHHPHYLAVKVGTKKLRYVMTPEDLEHYTKSGACPLVLK